MGIDLLPWSYVAHLEMWPFPWSLNPLSMTRAAAQKWSMTKQTSVPRILIQVRFWRKTVSFFSKRSASKNLTGPLVPNVQGRARRSRASSTKNALAGWVVMTYHIRELLFDKYWQRSNSCPFKWPAAEILARVSEFQRIIQPGLRGVFHLSLGFCGWHQTQRLSKNAVASHISTSTSGISTLKSLPRSKHPGRTFVFAGLTSFRPVTKHPPYQLEAPEASKWMGLWQDQRRLFEPFSQLLIYEPDLYCYSHLHTKHHGVSSNILVMGTNNLGWKKWKSYRTNGWKKNTARIRGWTLPFPPPVILFPSYYLTSTLLLLTGGEIHSAIAILYCRLHSLPHRRSLF